MKRSLFSGTIRTTLVFTLSFSLLLGTSELAAQGRIMPAAAKVAPEPSLTLEAISRDAGKWMGSAPGGIRWSEDGSKLNFQWNPERGDRSELYELDLRAPGGKPAKVPYEDQRWLSSNPGVRNADQTSKVYAFSGDLYLHDLSTGKTRQITMTSDSESNPRFTEDNKGILFGRGDNLFEWVIETGAIRQLSDFRRGRDPEEKPKLSKQDEYLEKQRLEMFEILQKQEKDEKEQRERNKSLRGPFPEATYLKESEAVSSLQLSPDRKFVTFVMTDRSEPSKTKVPEMPKYVTKSGYTETERLSAQIAGTGRVKVGAAQPKQKLGVMDTVTGKVTYVDFGLDKRAHSFQMIGSTDLGAPGASAVAWSKDGQKAFCVIRAQDNKDRWVFHLDVANTKAGMMDTEHDDAWIQSGGPYGWLPDNRTIWFRSEREGYYHIYTLSVTPGSQPKALTSGKWEVTSVQLSRDKSTFYLTTSESHPGERHLYTMPTSGGDRTRITQGEGVFNTTISPDEKWIAISYASPDSPFDLFMMENKPGAAARRLTESYTEEFKSYRWRKFEVVTIPDQYSNQLYARLYKPDKPHPMKPAVVYVHGAGYAQSVFKDWGNAGRTPFFNVLLQAGYTVLDLDYRGSSGYGRDCRTDIFRNMGGKDIDSGVAAAKWLVSTQGVDPRRIGIYGGSYGGFYTLMALFKHPGVFAAGAAMYPVTDWANYNHPYTSNILNLPYEDDEAYRQSSPIYFAAGLRDRLLILHGMHDRNVHYQDTILLTQKLIELKKTGWELATMPIEDHGWQNEYSRLDSNRRIFDLFEEVLKRPLSPLPRSGKSAASKSDNGKPVAGKK